MFGHSQHYEKVKGVKSNRLNIVSMEGNSFDINPLSASVALKSAQKLPQNITFLFQRKICGTENQSTSKNSPKRLFFTGC